MARRLCIRMALHTGDAQLSDEGKYFGVALNRCVRLRAVAHGGQVLLSGATAELVADQLPPGADLVNLGMHRLRDLGRGEHVFALSHPDLPGGVSPPRSLDRLPNNLPDPVDELRRPRSRAHRARQAARVDAAADAHRRRRLRQDAAGAAACRRCAGPLCRAALVARAGAALGSGADRIGSGDGRRCAPAARPNAGRGGGLPPRRRSARWCCWTTASISWSRAGGLPMRCCTAART